MYVYIYIYIYIHIYIYIYIDIETNFLRLINSLAAEEGVLEPHLHHSFENFIDTKISLKKV